MDNLIDEIVEQVYAQFNEEVDSPEQQADMRKGQERDPDKAKSPGIDPELIEIVKELTAKAEQHKELYTKVTEFLKMMQQGMLKDVDAEDLKSLFTEGKKEEKQIMNLIKTGKPENLQQAANIVAKQLDKQSQQIKNKMVPNIQNADENTIKTIAGTAMSFARVFKLAAKFPEFVKKAAKQPGAAAAAGDPAKMIEKIKLAVIKVDKLAESKKDIFVGIDGLFSRLLEVVFIPKGTEEGTYTKIVSQFGGDPSKVKEALASEALGAVLEKRTKELYKTQVIQEAEEDQTVVDVYPVNNLKEFNAMFTGKKNEEGGYEEGSGRYFVKSAKEEMVPVASKEQEKEQGKEEPGEMEDPELWDPEPEVKDEFINAYDAFRKRFYRVRKLIQQGQLVSALKSSLEKMAGDEEQEAAIERYSDEDKQQGAPPPEEKPEAEKPTANESQRPGQISEGFLKWLMISKTTELVLESINEADPDVVDKAMKDRDAAREKAGMNDKAEPPSNEEPPKEGEEIPQKDLQNIQADVESFYQNALKMRDGLQKIGELAKKGSASFSVFKKQWMKQANEIQQDIAELYQDLIKINPPKSALEEAEEGEQKEISDMNRVEKAKMLQKVYDKITDQLSPIVSALKAKDDIPYYRMEEPVEQSLKSLNTVLQMFPSVQAFKGGSFEDIIKGYDSMMSDLDVLTNLFQRLIKSGNMSSLTVRNLYKGIMKFSKGLEELFGVKSTIENKPAPAAADKPGEEKPEDDTGAKDTDGDKFSDDEEKQAETDPEDPQDVPTDTDKDGASDAAEDDAGTDKEDPNSKPEEPEDAKVFKTLPEIQRHIQNKIMPYEDFQNIFKGNENISVDQYNALMLLYVLDAFGSTTLPPGENIRGTSGEDYVDVSPDAPDLEEMVQRITEEMLEKLNIPTEKEKIGQTIDPEDAEEASQTGAVRGLEAYLGFEKSKMIKTLRQLKSLNKGAFDSLLNFFGSVESNELRALSRKINMKKQRFPFSIEGSKELKNKIIRQFQSADSDQIKKANAEQPPEAEKGGLAQRLKKASGQQLVPEQKLMKMLKPIVEKMLRGMNG